MAAELEPFLAADAKKRQQAAGGDKVSVKAKALQEKFLKRSIRKKRRHRRPNRTKKPGEWNDITSGQIVQKLTTAESLAAKHGGDTTARRSRWAEQEQINTSRVDKMSTPSTAESLAAEHGLSTPFWLSARGSEGAADGFINHDGIRFRNH